MLRTGPRDVLQSGAFSGEMRAKVIIRVVFGYVLVGGVVYNLGLFWGT